MRLQGKVIPTLYFLIFFFLSFLFPQTSCFFPCILPASGCVPVTAPQLQAQPRQWGLIPAPSQEKHMDLSVIDRSPRKIETNLTEPPFKEMGLWCKNIFTSILITWSHSLWERRKNCLLQTLQQGLPSCSPSGAFSVNLPQTFSLQRQLCLTRFYPNEAL